MIAGGPTADAGTVAHRRDRDQGSQRQVVAVDLSAARSGRADERRGRAVVAPCGDLGEALVRDTRCQRQPLRQDHADGYRNLPPAGLQRLLIPHHRCRSSSGPPIRPFIAPQELNGYQIGDFVRISLILSYREAWKFLFVGGLFHKEGL